jgi:hypothetical protein
MSKSKTSADTNDSTNDKDKEHDHDNDNDKHIKIEWSIENEEILVEWCDVAQCYRWLHMCSNRKYNTMHMYFTIPTITLSTITGTASFAQASLPQDYQAWASMAIGAINIFIGIITTIQQYLKVSELNEAHRVSALSWDKYARNIRIELAKAPTERTDARSFLKICRQEFDRLMETSPSIPVEIVSKFRSTFKGREGSIQREIYNDLKKPDILDIIVSSDINRHHWYKDRERNNPELYAQFSTKGDNTINLKKYSGDSEDNSYYNFKNLIFNSFKRRDTFDTTISTPPANSKRNSLTNNIIQGSTFTAPPNNKPPRNDNDNNSVTKHFFTNAFDIENAAQTGVRLPTNWDISEHSATRTGNDFIPKPNITIYTESDNWDRQPNYSMDPKDSKKNKNYDNTLDNDADNSLITDN